MTHQEALTALIEKKDLSRDEMVSVMRGIMSGEMTPVQIAGIVVALRSKGETVTEIASAASVMRELSAKVNVPPDMHLIDTCGTGGDGAHTFNISTASAIVAAAAGAKVAKHGGRSVSSTCGSADALERLGVNVSLTPDEVARCIGEIGIGFMFAPSHHSAMRFAAPVRRELGVRTIFNLLGPMTNPADAKNQVIGVYHQDLVRKFAEVLKTLDSRHVLIVHGMDGLDEISLSGETFVAELKDGEIFEYRLKPEDFGFAVSPMESIRVDDAQGSCRLLLDAIENRPGAARDIVALNAGASIYVAGLAGSIPDGVSIAGEMISNGMARAKLDELIAFSNSLKAGDGFRGS
ncbi:MAG: anthranilate phosphoribosyltransferase [Burkholderiales bacterium]|nr:anthranilate phosphoribosyltransferase [Burkholderiales bacterium]